MDKLLMGVFIRNSLEAKKIPESLFLNVTLLKTLLKKLK